jgi:hypothetical protein
MENALGGSWGVAPATALRPRANPVFITMRDNAKCSLKFGMDRGCVEDQPQQAAHRYGSLGVFTSRLVLNIPAAGLRHSRGPIRDIH